MKIVTSDTLSIENMTSFLLVGQTGSGKSYLMHKYIEILERKYTSKEAKYALFDMKRVEFQQEGESFKQTYLLFGVVTDSKIGLERLEYIARIADMRIRMKETSPSIFVYIEEFELAFEDQTRFDNAVTGILEKSKETSISLVYSSSRAADERAVSPRLFDAFSTILVGDLPSKEEADKYGVNIACDNRYDFRVVTKS